MLIDFIATIAAALAAGGLALIANHLSGWRLPKWLLPLAAGAGMLGYAIWAEYSWFDRTVDAYPDGFEVVFRNESSALWRPWTYLVPITTRFFAVDPETVKTHPEAPGQKMIDVLFVGRWTPVYLVPMLFDCPGQRRADLIDGMEFAADGTVANADWRDLTEDDPLLTAVCAEG
jgi:hypothetical protein